MNIASSNFDVRNPCASAEASPGSSQCSLSTCRMSKLHLGAFNCGIQGWINTDITPHIWIARIPFAAGALRLCGAISEERYREHCSGRFDSLRYLNLVKQLPYPDVSISAVFSSHVLEHLFLDEVPRLIVEIYRVLVPGGVCRMVVPDLEKIVRLFDEEDPRPFLNAMYEIGRRSDVKNAHHCGFTGKSLVRLFGEAGFSRSYVTEFRKGLCPDIDKLDNRPEESIFFEAIK
jgi:SAM-dependent methyltransferase